MAGFFDILFGGGAEREAAEKNRVLAQQYQDQSLKALQDTYNQGRGDLKAGISAFDPLAAMGQKYGQAGDLWMNALGVNGPAGNAVANAAFSTTPGYTLTQKAALDAVDRRRAIGGMYSSGNADIDTADWVTKNLYEQQYAPWMAGLSQAAQMGGQYTGAAAQGQAAGYGSLANLGAQFGQNQTGVYGNYMNTNVAANNQQAAGEAAGAKNLLGAGLSLAGMAFGAPGFGSGLGSMLSGAGGAGSVYAPSMLGQLTGGTLGNYGRISLGGGGGHTALY